MIDLENPDFPFQVIEEQDGSFTLIWDENHPVTSVFNTYTEQDFIDLFMTAANKVLGEE